MDQTVTFEGFQQTPNATVGICFFAAYLLFALLITALMVAVFCKIFSKSGYHWGMGFLCLIPGVGSLVAMLILAFGDWPILKELRAVRATHQPTPTHEIPPPIQGD